MHFLIVCFKFLYAFVWCFVWRLIVLLVLSQKMILFLDYSILSSILCEKQVILELFYLFLQIFSIKSVLILLIDQLFLFILERFKCLVAVPPPIFQQLPLLLLLPSFVNNQFFHIVATKFFLEHVQFLFEPFYPRT